ncbi:hypothetical protein V8G54_036488 [Vigna mungo]|uniref:Uncharacterized protein n=1 Tax=Vigna mungo TaxID=3915 RepID=A0AAQ3MIJ2_VIGMU
MFSIRPFQTRKATGPGGLGGVCKRHRIALLLVLLRETQRPRFHHNLHIRIPQRHHRSFIRSRSSDVSQNPRVLHSMGSIRTTPNPRSCLQSNRKRRVVEILHSVFPLRVTSKVPPRSKLDLKRRVVYRAEESQVVFHVRIIHQTRIKGGHGIHVSRAIIERRCRLPSRNIFNCGAVFVTRVRCCHECGSNSRRAPLRVRAFDNRGQATDVRARHGGSGNYVEADMAVVSGQPGRSNRAGPTG